MAKSIPLMAALMVAALLVSTAAAQDGYDQQRGIRYIFLCKAAFCNTSSLLSWNCGPTCDFQPQITDVTVIDNATLLGQSFTGYDPKHNEIFVAFRGTFNNSKTNWDEDFDFVHVPYPNPACGPKCDVHRGFHEVYRSMADRIKVAMAALHQKYPTASVVVTGHSLGAATATLCAVDLVATVPFAKNLTSYTFGTPRSGNTAFAEWADSIMPAQQHFRVVHNMDPVPHVPFRWMGYEHFPREVWLRPGINTAGYKVCNGTAAREDPTCSDSVSILKLGNFSQHMWYYNEWVQCDMKPKPKPHH